MRSKIVPFLEGINCQLFGSSNVRNTWFTIVLMCQSHSGIFFPLAVKISWVPVLKVLRLFCLRMRLSFYCFIVYLREFIYFSFVNRDFCNYFLYYSFFIFLSFFSKFLFHFFFLSLYTLHSFLFMRITKLSPARSEKIGEDKVSSMLKGIVYLENAH